MSLQEFTDYLASSGEDINTLTREEKRAWRETFDKCRQTSGQLGNIIQNYIGLFSFALHKCIT
jgi:hypothetical protein